LNLAAVAWIATHGYRLPTWRTQALFIDTALPAKANLAVVDELSNPDPCAPSDIGCVPFGQANAGTYRIEVREPLNPHMLLGLMPNGHYAATLSAGLMQINQSAAGEPASTAVVLYLNADAIFINGFE
jgi:hypothetical protein